MIERLACILTYREGEGKARRLNLDAFLRSLASHPELIVVVVEQDAVPRLEGSLPHPRAQHLFAYNPGPFNKSWGLNLGVRVVRSPWLMFTDADIVLGRALAGAVELLAAGYSVVKPYVRILDLDETESRRVRDGDFDWVPERAAERASDREAKGEFPPFAGGAVMMTQGVYDRMGGWDERFLGWGGEDDAMSYLLERARVPGTQLDLRPAVHLHHPRSPSSTSGQPHYRSNLTLLSEYQAMSDERLDRFLEIRRQLNGHRDKYRPLS
ncbi:glycosyltransferase family 2 protein [Wenzhouxiangella sediminis]|uniref:Galactosyltransferase C-terminal domain-containing protein n=1 Tax=Wenzhouxiangella sediminis TaxID=1792836 RepID=A0A3E1K5I3_9GAMM|nr:galactosyltransferase-related protein [Wenzhouxiangella sediminis]RFF29293.1 hypothetical protein DZC52_13370 [Wenzhouxiangella sediminis]